MSQAVASEASRQLLERINALHVAPRRRKQPKPCPCGNVLLCAKGMCRPCYERERTKKGKDPKRYPSGKLLVPNSDRDAEPRTERARTMFHMRKKWFGALFV